MIELRHGSSICVALDRAALALGIVPGISLADARARVPQLAAVPFDFAADTALLDWLADGCARYTPSVATDPPHGLLLDITGCTEPYGGAPGLMADLQRRLQRLGLSPMLALGTTPDGAAALARYPAAGDLNLLPVTALRVDPAIHLALRRAGLNTIGDLAVRPRTPLTARFGSLMTEQLARLLGERDVRITPRHAPPMLLVEQRCAEPLTHSEAALRSLDQLMIRAAVQLGERGSGGRRFDAALFRSDGHVARLSVATATPTRDPKVLTRLLRERIGALNDPFDPGFGFDLIQLAVPVVEPLATQQLRLEGGAVADAEIAALFDRLGARLGQDRVRRFMARDSHIPEQAAFELAINETTQHVPWPLPEPGEPPLRPLHLFDPPQRIEVIAQVPDGPPRRFHWRRVQHEVTRYEGPERIAAQWWRRRDGRGLTRDYYRVEDIRGRRFWLFRHGLYAVEKVSPDWYLHGLFA